eukprot:TRINITY_DN1300_c0_g1_i1.p1 TRINITY_DN1300_c0_g1~~TRINITY_DN1300_c0_g1_i1.p1  ORF type:complete len:290 (-),score=38.90 TRINITY_DN1300_c0_g1_i1:65-934(-)
MSVVIITGSAKGLGKGFAQSLLKKGCFIALSDISEEEGQETLSEFRGAYGDSRVTFVQCDVRSQEDFQRLWAETEAFFGKKVDVLVNNAGVSGNHSSCLDINLYGTMTGVEVAHKHMSKGCSIINIGSMAGLVPHSKVEGNNYFVSKRGVVTLTRVLGEASKNSGIYSSVLCPYFVDTNLVQEAGIKSEITRMGGGLLTVERVVEGFNHLFENPGKYNGKALVVAMDSPFFTMPIYNWTYMIWLAMGAKWMKKIYPNMEIYNTGNQFMFMALLFGVYALLMELLIMLLF